MKKCVYLLIVFAFVFIACEKKSRCVFDQSKKNSRIYDTDQAICYIDSVLAKESPGTEIIAQALKVQEDYLRKVGVITDQVQSQVEMDSIDSFVHDDDMISYALKKGRLNLSREQITEVYWAESDYAMFIGLMSEIKASDLN